MEVEREVALHLLGRGLEGEAFELGLLGVIAERVEAGVREAQSRLRPADGDRQGDDDGNGHDPLERRRRVQS